MASFELQIVLLLRQKPKFLLKIGEIQGTRSCRNVSPEPVGVQLGMPWLGDEGAVGQASANPSPPPLLSDAKLKRAPPMCRACSLPSYPSLFCEENDPLCNTAQGKALESQPFPAPCFTEAKTSEMGV